MIRLDPKLWRRRYGRFLKGVRKKRSFEISNLVKIPVKMFWNASSTLLASRAEVSMNERLLSAVSKSVFMLFQMGAI